MGAQKKPFCARGHANTEEGQCAACQLFMTSVGIIRRTYAVDTQRALQIMRKRVEKRIDIYQREIESKTRAIKRYAERLSEIEAEQERLGL